MITSKENGAHFASWQEALRGAFTRVDDLWTFLQLDPPLLNGARAADRDFPLLVPREFAALLEKGNPNDPLLRQIMPVSEELVAVPGFGSDPVGDEAMARGFGILRKYRGRALVVTTGACAVHCRYCFRRHFAYNELAFRRGAIQELVATLRQDPGLSEVVLSGGDPLMLDDEGLERLVGQIAGIPNIRRVRLHTRLPVVLPERITPRLCRLLADLPQTTLVVIQANHPRELRPSVCRGLRALRQKGITLLNQSVLLRGVNDSAITLSALSEALIDAGVLPYYLHQLDPVQGAAHFEVRDRQARALMRDLRTKLPGYLIPRLVREIAGAPSKVPLI